MFILRNRTPHQIAGYTGLWRSAHYTDGARPFSFTFINSFTFRDPEAIPAGSDRIVTPVPGLGYRQLPDQAVLASLQAKVLARFGTQKDVTASLDAVILDDGTLLGPDTRNAGPHVQGKVDAYRDIADQLLNAIQDRAGVEALAGILVQNATYVAPLKQLRTADEAAYNRSYWGTRKSRSLQYSMVLAKEGLGALSRLCQTTADRELPTIHR